MRRPSRGQLHCVADGGCRFDGLSGVVSVVVDEANGGAFRVPIAGLTSAQAALIDRG